jgi:hypothetical protein
LRRPQVRSQLRIALLQSIKPAVHIDQTCGGYRCEQ